jgi:hypothetical protein
MALGAVSGGYYCVNLITVVLKAVFVLRRVHGVAFGAADRVISHGWGNLFRRYQPLKGGFGDTLRRGCLGMGAFSPVLNDARVQGGVALDAHLAVFTGWRTFA